jgi:hypothetical protein
LSRVWFPLWSVQHQQQRLQLEWWGASLRRCRPQLLNKQHRL